MPNVVTVVVFIIGNWALIILLVIGNW